MYFLRRDEDAIAHFLIITVWDSLESVKRFAGSKPELAKYYSRRRQFPAGKENMYPMYHVSYEK